MPSHKATTHQGMLERIKQADDADAISALLKEGDGYPSASKATKRRWKRAAQERAREVGA